MKSLVPFLAISSALFSASLSAPLPLGSSDSIGNIGFTNPDIAQIPMRASQIDSESGNVAGKPVFVKRALNAVHQLSTVDQAVSDRDSFAHSHTLIPAATERLQKRTDLHMLLELEERLFAEKLAKWMHFSTFPTDAPPLIQEKWLLHKQKVHERVNAKASGAMIDLPPKDYIRLTKQEVEIVKMQIRDIKKRQADAANPSSSAPSGSSPTARSTTSWFDSLIDFLTERPRVTDAGIARNSNADG